MGSSLRQAQGSLTVHASVRVQERANFDALSGAINGARTDLRMPSLAMLGRMERLSSTASRLTGETGTCHRSIPRNHGTIFLFIRRIKFILESNMEKGSMVPSIHSGYDDSSSSLAGSPSPRYQVPLLV